ncbi:hypothetical protein CCACVL1_27380, partial [Corchorus capsularis]
QTLDYFRSFIIDIIDRDEGPWRTQLRIKGFDCALFEQLLDEG